MLLRSEVRVQHLQLIRARCTSKNPGSKTTVPTLSGPVPWSEEAEISGSPINHYLPPRSAIRPIVSGCPTLLKATSPGVPYILRKADVMVSVMAEWQKRGGRR